ncbi:hypothetical protein M3Y98_00632300 [Aphelenchoides besseyi]|nr:hypothetical protein M3Y98_00632300 [Aphelenchoides besseyi]KAI6208487.1 hypothetical protein M3Y96_00120600 [Aphelenchoides besseyi]
MDWRLPCFLILLTAMRQTVADSVPEPRKQCRDHYLAGEFRSKVLPLSNGGEVFKIECEFSETMYPPMPVGTVIRNALQIPFDLKDEKKTVAYQITERDYLLSLIRTAKTCNQQLEIMWPPQPTEASANILQFTAERITQTKELGPLGMIGILHLLPDSNNFTARVKLSPLRCLHDVIEDKNCEFEQNTYLNGITITTSSADEFSFAFRTDKPSDSLLHFTTASNRVVKLELIDGYILRFEQMYHSVKLLADGNWHTVIVDLKSSFLYIDGRHNPGLAMSTYLKERIEKIRITLKGIVSQIQLDQGSWQCRGSILLTLDGHVKPEPLRQICQKDQASYCQCKAPTSALSKDSTAPLCSIPNIAKGFSLDRDPQKLSFFFLKSPVVQKSVSVLFRSDSDSGLVLFGQRNDSGETEKFQVEFDGKYMTAGACLNAEGTIPCRSCRIERSSGFGSNQWIRVSLFKHQQYIYLTVDDQICTLSPNAAALDWARMYVGPAHSSFLFIGGSHYMKSKEIESVKSNLNPELNSYYDHTHQKALSLRGCIAEVHINGAKMDLQKLFSDQSRLLKNPRRSAEIFAMTLGCTECTMDCGQFACRRVAQDRDVCDCGQHFGIPSATSNTCNNKADPINLTAQKSASVEYRFRKPAHKRVIKWWTHVLLPNSNDELYPILTIGDFIISVGDYGQTVLISAPEYGISEQFEVISDDARLHLISVEVSSDALEKKDLLIRVDNQIHRLASRSFSNYDISINALKRTSETDSGCVNGIYFALDGEVEESSNLSFIDVLHDLQFPPAAKQNLTLMASDSRLGCGILDPQLWESESSSLGYVGEYDPFGYNRVFRLLTILFYVIIILLVTAIFVGLLVYFIRIHRAHKYNVQKATECVIQEEDRPLVSSESFYRVFETPKYDRGVKEISSHLTNAINQQTPVRPR